MVHRVVRCVVVFIVEGMRTSEHLDAEFRRLAERPSPRGWRLQPPDGRRRTLGELAGAVRPLGRESDELVRRLIVVDDDRDLAAMVIVVGLMPLVLARGARDRNIVDDLLTELVLVIGNARVVAFDDDAERVGGLLVDRAADRLRWRRRRPRHEVAVAPQHLLWDRASAALGPEDLALDRVYLDDMRRVLSRSGPNGTRLVRSWDVAVSLADQWMARPALTGRPREQYKYAVERLRQHGRPEQAA